MADTDRVVRGEKVTAEDLVDLIAPQSLDDERELLRCAHERRVESLGPDVHLRAIIEFSNYCRQDCLYCGLRRSNPAIRRFRLSAQEIIEAARAANSIHHFGTFVLQSGEDPDYPPDELARAIEVLSEMGAVTLSVGERTRDEYRLWREAGASRFLLRFETSDEGLFRALKPTTTLRKRISCLYTLRDLGYQIGSGMLLGLPGQDSMKVARDLMLLKDLDVEMLSVGPFIPHPGTPLGSHCPGEPAALIRLTLKVMALGRLLVPSAHIPATTALATLSKSDKDWFPVLQEVLPSGCRLPDLGDARSAGLLCGANVIMPDVTPLLYRSAYEIYPGKPGTDGKVLEDTVAGAINMISALGMKIAAGKGDSPKEPWRGA